LGLIEQLPPPLPFFGKYGSVLDYSRVFGCNVRKPVPHDEFFEFFRKINVRRF
jgi:hypothetical protein